MTAPSEFYVRSPLALWQFFCPHPCREQWMASISAVKVPKPPCSTAAQASPLMTSDIPPKTRGSGRSRSPLVNPSLTLRQRVRAQCG
ncbi:hypothetical protein BBOMB_1577 [Bifidobacterium bombi DSM 19703]|uniref:Uncharacterized protein n=1 Tax=Bifidobacterium bombi DSM 19703 TaxID=1341695 RepID=A0A086BND6_9BIFI|nr:hypothetical protein BBOMB_1577 [Bifidobacterium bombi DSM 19703]